MVVGGGVYEGERGETRGECLEGLGEWDVEAERGEWDGECKKRGGGGRGKPYEIKRKKWE